MKKISLLLMIILLSLLLLACGSKMTSVKVEYTASPGGRIEGSEIQSKEVEENEKATFSSVTAVADDGYKFLRWSDGSTNAERTDTLTQSASFEAIFEKLKTYKLVYMAGVGGKIDGASLQEVNEGEMGSAVTATPFDSYRFVRWSDGITTPTRTDIANKDLTLTAIFEEFKLSTISYVAENGGSIVGKATQMVQNGQITESVTAVASEGYRFLGWDDGVTEATRYDTVVGDKTYTAMFTNGVIIKYEAQEGGRIEGNTTQNVPLNAYSGYVTAVASEGYEFVSWSDGKTTPKRNDKGVSDITYTAIFAKLYSLYYKCDSTQGSLTGEAMQFVGSGSISSPVTAIPNEGYQFVCWSSGDTNPTIWVTASEDATYTAYFSKKSSGLPVISIDTETGKDVTSKEEYIDCVVTVFDTEGNEYHVANQTAQIRGRGNSTWTNFDKKPYKIKFTDKQNLFGFGKAREWVLLANYIDRILLRNQLAYKTAKLFSNLGSSPDCISVEVYLNGEYHGVYLLCEQVEVNKHRVEVSEDYSVTDTGFLLELDGWKDGTYVSVPDKLNSGRAYVIKDPGETELTYAQIIFIENYMKKCIAAAEGNDYEAVKELIDVTSFAQAYIVFELFKCPDVDYSSFYLHKDAGGKLFCGPVWDFDMGIGNVTHKGNAQLRNYNSLWVRQINPWFNALMNFKEFRDLVGQNLLEYKDDIESLLKAEYDYAYSKEEAMEKNFEKWQIMGQEVWTNPYEFKLFKSWSEHVEFTREYLKNGLEFLIETYANE